MPVIEKGSGWYFRKGRKIMKKEAVKYRMFREIIGRKFEWRAAEFLCAMSVCTCLTLLAGCFPATSWHQVLSSDERFELVMGEEAVLDNETGLVWERVPSDEFIDWFAAVAHCYERSVGDRYGWRLPAVEELASLMGGGLPSGHPFTVVPTNYWTITTDTTPTNLSGGRAWIVNTVGNVVKGQAKSAPNRLPWCVRGGQGHDGNDAMPSSP
jgi:hypothetical protein